MKKGLTLVIITLFGIVVLAQDSTPIDQKQQWQIGYAGYFQVSASSANQNFEIPFAKLFIHGNHTKHQQLTFHIELRPTSGNPLVKAYVSDSLHPLLHVLIGQLSNPIKYVEPQPEKKSFVYYALYERFVANADDIGIAAHGKDGKFSYYCCVVNGTSRNVSDNNTAKDVAVYLSYAFLPTLQAEVAGQAGKQPAGNREAGFTRILVSPVASIQMSAAIMKRTDLRDWGWYLTGSYTIGECQLLGRAHQTSQRGEREWTVGFQTDSIPLKLQLNVIIGSARHPEAAVVMQLFVK